MGKTKKIFKRLFQICRYDWNQLKEEDQTALESELGELLNFDIDINMPNVYFKGSLLLCEASRLGNEKVVKILLKNGAEVNTCDRNKCSPLYIASSQGHIKVVEIFVRHHADVNSRNLTGYMPLLSAVENNHMQVARVLVEAGANVNIARPNTFGVEMTLMAFVLFAKNDIPFADVLLNAGVLPHKFQKPLNYLLLDGSSECRTFLQKLIMAGFDLYCKDWVKMTNAKINGQIAEVSESEINMLRFLENEHKIPSRLERQCRTIIRSSLTLAKHKPTGHLQTKIDCLPIPFNLKRFLLLEYL
ncbi:ankyrin repeat, PH and SEC7 domain containing protein secG [Patella vulgata]|uniref:ankyrin repeat, PH and SEC7 domain containing protein secG n=1 Tax=Patella vulgata TaxID=6465 RepID=UPI0021803C30|nr:ankyrin repeat, PH and SEC7 domain containing protein secG [Patella vulgata]XP_050418476.1 ankyrin repeat, PH and SEC7 domain containing protein secG [Patella vulgata]XP_050418477.1 ankyrin repeat, PH and SEC7 domain containing protein secG [Patella vulgata]